MRSKCYVIGNNVQKQNFMQCKCYVIGNYSRKKKSCNVNVFGVFQDNALGQSEAKSEMHSKGVGHRVQHHHQVMKNKSFQF